MCVHPKPVARAAPALVWAEGPDHERRRQGAGGHTGSDRQGADGDLALDGVGATGTFEVQYAGDSPGWSSAAAGASGVAPHPARCYEWPALPASLAHSTLVRPRAVAARILVRALVALAAASLAAGSFVASPARADDEPPESRTGDYSPYERETLREVQQNLGAPIDRAPEGKIVESIEVVTLDVFEKRDPLPRFLNVFHGRSRPHVIAREVLLAEGQPFRGVLADETARNLRQLRQLSLVLVVPLRGSAPERVRLVVVTKDVWSLRLNSDFRFASGKLEYLLLQPSEENLAGLHQRIAAQLILEPLSYSLGGRYGVRRLFGTWVTLGADANVIANRETGQAEGSFGNVSVGQPLYSTRTEWAWEVGASWVNQVTRRYVNGELASFNARATPQPDRIPWNYRSRTLSGTATVTRSFGWALKHDLLAGAMWSAASYRAYDLSGYDPAAAAAFRSTVLPLDDTRLGPVVQYRTYRTDFLRVLDFEALGLQEDFRLGHELYARAWPAAELVGSSRNVLGLYGGVQYTVALGDGLARANVESVTELDATGMPDASVQTETRLVTPRLGFGRLVFSALLVDRYRNHLNRNSYLGGDTRLRGYPTRAFFGSDVLAYNLEFRTRPVEILACQLGAAAFFDAGDAFDDFSSLRIKKGAGFGLRALFPQADKLVLRLDWGFPLNPEHRTGGFPGQVFATFGQAFALPSMRTL
jgi:hypothetical protein